MAYVYKKKLAKRSNYGNKRPLSAIKKIVIHFTANDGDTDENNGKYFANNTVYASAQYFVDGDSVTQSVPDNYVAYSVGGSKYPNCNTTGGGKKYGVATNYNTLNIELCDDVKNGKIYPSQKTIDNALELTRKLMKKYNISKENVIRHFDVTGKPCPAYWCGTDAKNKKWKTEFWDRLDEKEVKVVLAGAMHDENKKYKGGKDGDQLQKSNTNDTKGELRFIDFRIHQKGYYCSRFIKDEHADAYVEAFVQAVNNKNIGYNQEKDKRYDIIDMLKEYGSLGAIAEPTSCVCSSLTRACILQATGIDLGEFLTGDMPKLMDECGLFEPKFVVKSVDDVLVSDILYTLTSGHTESVVKGKQRPKKNSNSFQSYKVKITCKTLNVRSKAGTKYKITTQVKKDEIYTIIEEKMIGKNKWGKLKSGAGWIHLGYTKKV